MFSIQTMELTVFADQSIEFLVLGWEQPVRLFCLSSNEKETDRMRL